MTNKIVISFDADGTAEYTRTKALTLFGGAGTMQRVTDIKKVPAASLYYIHWMLGPHAGEPHRFETARQYLGPYALGTHAVQNERNTVHFPTYEAAVAHEIEVLNAMRKAGVRFGDEAA